ncbi:hypothetical protein QTI24_05725 [Variovorax sp. J22P240]|uniref:hypothetical protein n=1 Tax=Variovorax sp. J22P240 TaxID=3053514 RepID=UPI0025789DDD|nr:hypothetical protein [Variovorax sp. J22P240]MDL9998093.1 hypothetical protein [Variovorax sp. J22P240]
MDELLTFTLEALAVVYVLATTFLRKRRLSSDPFHPRFVYRYLVCLTLLFPIMFGRAEMSEASKQAVLLTCLIFLVALDGVDLFFGGGAPDAHAPLPTGEHDAFYARTFLVLYVAGWLWRGYALSTGLLYGTFLATQLEVESYGNLVGQLNGLGLLALMGYLVFVNSSSFTKIAVAMIAGELIWALISGSKSAVFHVVLPALLVAFRRDWIKVRARNVLAAGVFLVVAIQLSFIAVSAYRLGVHQSIASGQGLSAGAVLDGLKSSISSPTQDAGESTGTGLMDRLNWASFYGALLERPDLWRQPWYGDSYFAIVTWWIPRVFWAEKPDVSIGAWYGEAVLDWDFGARSEGAATIWGDALLNFGILGALSISVVWLLLVQFVYRNLGRHGKWGLLFLAMIYMRLLLGLEQNMAAPVVAIQQQCLILLLLYFLLRFMARLSLRSPYR